MIDLNEFRENARKKDLCAEYSKLWDRCKSRKQLIDLALSSKGLDYLCCSVTQGWGISSDLIYKDFARFINGMYVSEQKGYTSCLFCQMAGSLVAYTTVLGIIDCDMSIEVPKNHLVEIYCGGKCKIELSGEGECVVINYGDPSNTIIEGSCFKFKRIDKEDMDKHE